MSSPFDRKTSALRNTNTAACARAHHYRTERKKRERRTAAVGRRAMRLRVGDGSTVRALSRTSNRTRTEPQSAKRRVVPVVVRDQVRLRAIDRSRLCRSSPLRRHGYLGRTATIREPRVSPRLGALSPQRCCVCGSAPNGTRKISPIRLAEARPDGLARSPSTQGHASRLRHGSVSRRAQSSQHLA